MRTKAIELIQQPTTITPNDSCWPKALADLCDPPLWLRIAGRLPVLDRAVAVVGTRSADEEAEQFTHRLAAELCAANCVVISGGAYGIDAAAHAGALEASGRTIAVLATGLKQAYPPRHGALFSRIAEQGALVTEAADSGVVKPGLFLKRNRLIAAMAQVVVVAQAPCRSGALSTAGWAKRLGRPLLAVPSAPWEPRGAGCLELIREGATICTSARDVLSVCFPNREPHAVTSRDFKKNTCEFSALDKDEKRVIRTLGCIPSHPDEVSRRSGLPISVVQRVLLALMLRGIVKRQRSGKYVKGDLESTDGNSKEIESSDEN
ncbi:MAG: DNA-processing protein DprA [Deltaproteobacteria bacterium]|nr:DNA-processing protein DprA [Deltaproteobacteria bacterium]